MNEEARRVMALKAVIAGIVSVLSGVGTYAGIAPEWTSPYFVGTVLSAGTGLISVFYAAKRIVAGEPAEPTLPL